MTTAKVALLSDYELLTPGDPAPWFEQRTPTNPEFRFDTIGGRYSLLAFFGSTQTSAALTALHVIQARRQLFDDQNLCFFGFTLDQADELERKTRNIVPGIRFFFDFNGKAHRLFGALPRSTDFRVDVRPRFIILDRMLRVVANVPYTGQNVDVDVLLKIIDDLPPFLSAREPSLPAPVLMVPRVFSADLCAHLVSLYEADGGHESGFMNETDGKTIGTHDYRHKRRRDYFIESPALIREIQNTLTRRLLPEIEKSFQYHVTHIERYIVACYSAKDEGHFNAHRDNTTKGTAHRRFAVTLNLNDAFEGGELSFPEFGPKSYRAPPGGAVVFSCSLLHAASTVSEGVRYAFLPFLYDEAAARIRDINRATIISASEREGS